MPVDKRDKRDCWGSARERERMKARFNIRQRVNNSMAHQEGPSPSKTTAKAEASDDVMSKYLLYIRRGDRSKFSTTFMDRHFVVVSSLHSAQKHIFEKSETLNETLRVAINLRGPEYSLSLEMYMKSLSTFTLMEYAVWLGKYSIVSSMLHGGVNPCVRGSSWLCFDSLGKTFNSQRQFQNKIQELQWQRQQRQLTEIGSKVLKRFFDSFPLRLSTYIVQSVVKMRQDGSKVSNNDIIKDEDKYGVKHTASRNGTAQIQVSRGEKTTFHCPICGGTICVNFRLTFKSSKHDFCEMCFWNDMLTNIDSITKREAQNVISCLVCGKKESNDNALFNPNNKNKKLLQSDISHLSPIEKAKLSLEKLYQLPANQRELKLATSKKKKLSEMDHLASNWLEAVVPSLGSTQDVRLDKFKVHVERNAIPFVKGCLLAGVDINKTNEYGQTALYVAAWRGYIDMVKLLLEHGADPCIPANGNSTVAGVYSSVCPQDNIEVFEVLGGYSASSLKKVNVIDDYGKADQSELRYTELISASSTHPGAGSCFINDALSSKNIEALLKLFHSLPIDTNQKKKKNSAPCSDRSYFCDAEGSLRRLIGNAVTRSGLVSSATPAETIDDNYPLSRSLIENSGIQYASSVLRVFPHMRFLNYTSAGTVLPPHIDLCRVNPFCRPSDKQRPEHRSTHTFILYLTDCKTGGETSLLEEVTADGSAATLAKVSPRKGRLLIFPHPTPHEGMEVVDVPKILLRGELQISTKV